MQPDWWQELWREHRGKLVGGGLGFLLAAAILMLGFWRALFLLFATWLGYAMGRRVDDGEEDIWSFLDKLWARRPH